MKRILVPTPILSLVLSLLGTAFFLSSFFWRDDSTEWETSAMIAVILFLASTSVGVVCFILLFWQRQSSTSAIERDRLKWHRLKWWLRAAWVISIPQSLGMALGFVLGPSRTELEQFGGGLCGTALWFAFGVLFISFVAPLFVRARQKELIALLLSGKSTAQCLKFLKTDDCESWSENGIVAVQAAMFLTVAMGFGWLFYQLDQTERPSPPPQRVEEFLGDDKPKVQ